MCFQTLMFWYVCVCVCVCVRARVRIYGGKEGERDLKKKPGKIYIVFHCNHFLRNIYFLNIYTFFHRNHFLRSIYFFDLAALGLHCCTRTFSSCGQRRLLSSCSAWASSAVASPCRAQALGMRASVAVSHRLSCPTACEIFLDQGSNQCPRHCEVDS